jgi:type II secretory pathway pseudopilin PulG
MNGRNHFKNITSFHGFTYMSVLVLIIVTGIALTSASRSWRLTMQREREKELLFKGDQIRSAIKSYYNAMDNKYSYPSRLEDLLKDPRFLATRRHLRKIYKDPMLTGGEWGIILASGNTIKGVYSKSDGVPLKKGNFSHADKNFELAKTYSDWKFVFIPDKTADIKKG